MSQAASTAISQSGAGSTGDAISGNGFKISPWMIAAVAVVVLAVFLLRKKK